MKSYNKSNPMNNYNFHADENNSEYSHPLSSSFRLNAQRLDRNRIKVNIINSIKNIYRALRLEIFKNIKDILFLI